MVIVICANFSVVAVVLSVLVLRLVSKQTREEFSNPTLECFISNTFKDWLSITKSMVDIKYLRSIGWFAYLIVLVAYPGFILAKLIAGLTISTEKNPKQEE
jgi:hypothetical protein